MTTSEILQSISMVFKGLFDIFVRGLINFDNPLLSIMDYILWVPTIIGLTKKLLKR